MAAVEQVCVIIGASHAGVNLAFSLRREGWQGSIVLIDSDPYLPYHRPPLSKAFLTKDDGIEKNMLKPSSSYEKENITLTLGVTVVAVDGEQQQLTLSDGSKLHFDKLVLATGARAFIPPIEGLHDANNMFALRSASDVMGIKSSFKAGAKRVVVIGGGYIGLETAASLKKMGAQVTVLEREERALARVTSSQMSAFFTQLHQKHDVDVLTEKDVIKVATSGGVNTIVCADGSEYIADMIIVGVGIRVNTELAEQLNLTIENGIKVNSRCQTSNPDVYAIGDNSFHFNPIYQRYIRLESVQNAVDQAKVAAAAIAGKDVEYDALPWFWSDQYDVKLQMVGLSQGYNNIVLREESEETAKFSTWYFKDDTLLAVDAVNNGKAYVFATKLMKQKLPVDKVKLADSTVDWKALL
ncbi:NAD(P)/FAD-dependent oxidoreductase [Thalassotalea agarivorans]|uniref:3-phenylpropionate/trans-cinnamate dioxygenase ferredoxin reductase subunit n=1 Tax=Thalassotalea agarivorans TaxID=349064 RepID=A0A1I0DXR0_THASX|nr:FAD/NAD(P)-binding oxidoreductase [Thalassotalea agarivorans]SET37503.1 3-phenylpropionate/trans-cinnamate dioxygenase ferredoxin reductase subunit [Thalassotalea agarivorans]